MLHLTDRLAELRTSYPFGITRPGQRGGDPNDGHDDHDLNERKPTLRLQPPNQMTIEHLHAPL
jgi:hypothetical protein